MRPRFLFLAPHHFSYAIDHYPTKAEFVKKVNAICAKGNKNIESEFESFAKEHNLSQNKEPSDAVKEEAANEIVIPQISNQVKEIRALGTPQGDEGELEELLEKVEEALEEIEEDPSLLFGNESTFKEVNKLSREYGLTVCGEEEGE